MTRKHLPIDKKTWHDTIDWNRATELAKDLVIVSDVDGILTTGVIDYNKKRKFAKHFGGHDKEMLQICCKLNIPVMFVSDDAAGWDITKARLKHISKINPELISYKKYSADERYELVKSLLALNLKVVFIGDSISDIATLNIATYACTTSNAFPVVKEYVNYSSPYAGGLGGFADIIYHLLLSEFPILKCRCI